MTTGRKESPMRGNPRAMDAQRLQELIDLAQRLAGDVPQAGAEASAWMSGVASLCDYCLDRGDLREDLKESLSVEHVGGLGQQLRYLRDNAATSFSSSRANPARVALDAVVQSLRAGLQRASSPRHREDALPASTPKRSGDDYGEWRPVRSLGGGGQGDVLEVEHVDTGLRGALKRLRNLRRRDRFEAEVEALRVLDHSNIVHLLDVSLDTLVPFLVMEVAPGGSVADLSPADLAAVPLDLRLYVFTVGLGPPRSRVAHRVSA
ncbi:MAG: protein kinase domain-containing protein [Bryobacteraceae bacterium]